MVKVVTYRDKKKTDHKQAWWSEKQKFEVVSAYVLFGNYAQTARITGVPEDTVRRWKNQTWWKDAENEIRLSSKVELSGKLRKAIELANIALEDRLVNGDFLYDPKTGQIIRKPVSADTALKTLDRLLDRQEMLDQSVKRLEVTTDEGTQERLAKLAKQFIEFANAKTIEGESNVISEAIDAEVVREEEGGSEDGTPEDPVHTYDSDDSGYPDSDGTGDDSGRDGSASAPADLPGHGS